MKNLTITIILMILSSSILFAQSNADVDPNAVTNPHATTITDDLFDHQFDFICGDASGEAGIETNGDHIYTSKWNGDGFFCYEMDGTFLGAFPVPGESAVRDMAYDGTYFYGAAASTALYEMDFDGQSGTLISILTAAVATRAIAHNADYDAFYGNNWSDPITLYDRTGNILNQFSCGSYSSYYGFTWLNDAGIPWLYGFAQSGGASQAVIVQIDPETGDETGITFDAIGYSLTGTGIGGGLAAFNTYAPGWWTLLGIIQNETIFGVEGGVAGPPPDLDLALKGILEPNSGFGLGVEDIVIKVKNQGAITQTDFDVQYRVNIGSWINETIPGPLAMGESIDYTFETSYDFSEFGEYFIEAEVILAGDEYPDNNFDDKTIENWDPLEWCFYSITMWDDYGDGWNGGFVQILGDGVEFINATLAAGSGPETIEFLVEDGVFLTAVWTAGGWPYECSYIIYDQNEEPIFEDGMGGVEPVGGDIGYASCAPLPPFDAGVIQILSPQTGMLLGVEPVIIKVKNFGSEELSEIPVGFNLDGLGWINGIIPDSIGYNEEVEYTFTDSVDLSEIGTYIIVACTFVPDDEDPLNDCMETQIENHECTYCYASTNTEDEWIAHVLMGDIDNASGWQGGVADYTDQFTIVEVGIPQEIVVTNGNAWAQDNVTVWVDWNEDCEWEQGGDEEFVLNNDGTGSYFTGNIIAPANAIEGSHRMRIRMTYSVQPYPCCNSDYGEVEDYTVVVNEFIPFSDAGVTLILSPVSGFGLGVEQVTITVKNFSNQTLPEIPVGFNLDAGGFINEIVPGPIDPWEEVEYTFAITVDLSEFGTHSLVVCTFVPDDEDPLNDCVEEVIINNDPSQACQWSVTMWDDNGDGWNGGLLQILSDSIEMFSGTLASGSGPETFFFMVPELSLLTAVFTQGDWTAYQNSYAINDPFGNTVFEDGMEGDVPEGGEIGIAYCELPICDWSVTMWDDNGDGWNGGLLLIISDSIEIFSGTLASGSGPETFIFSVTDFSLLTAVYTPDSCAYENSYAIHDPFGNTVFEDGMGGNEPIGGEIGIAYCTEPLFPEIAVYPLSFYVSLFQCGTGQEFLNISNIGLNELNFAITIGSGTDSNPPINIVKETKPDANIKAKEYTYILTESFMECPIETAYGMVPDMENAAVTSELNPDYVCYQFIAGYGVYEGIGFWGLNLTYNEEWDICDTEDPMEFEIGFYADNAGEPGILIHSEVVSILRDDTGELLFDLYPVYYYQVAFSTPIALAYNWISVQGLTASADDCWFLWKGADEGLAPNYLQWDGSAFNLGSYPLALCLTGELSEPWLTANTLAGTIDPQGSETVTLDFNAGDHLAGTVLNTNLIITSNDPITPEIIVPVEMTVNDGYEQHFPFEGGGGDTWIIYLAGATFNDYDLEEWDEIAIFDGNLLVGAIILDQVCTPDNAFDNDLTAYSILTSQPGYQAGNDFSFKCWDASEQIEADFFLYEFFDPFGDAWMGDVFPAGEGEYSVAALDFMTVSSQQFDLSFGFSFISSAVDPMDSDMMVVMADVLNDNLDFVRNSQGQTIRRIGPNWINGIGDWIVEEGYLVKMFAEDLFVIEGFPVNPTTPIPIEAGFQFISFFPKDPLDALEAYSTIIGDDLDFIRNSHGQTLRKIGPNWVNGIGDCQPGEGYLVKMFAEDILIYPTSTSFTCGDPFTDSRDDQIYTTIQIGDQCWMAKNLNIGTLINSSENMTDNGVIEKYCYNNDTVNCEIYGGLYQWNEMMKYNATQGVQGICPTGWHLPSDEEWTTITDFLGGKWVAGGKMKEAGTSHWNPPNTSATNESGFTSLPGGYRVPIGSFEGLGNLGYWWSSTQYISSYARRRSMLYDYGAVFRGYGNKTYSFSVRCVRINRLFDNLSIWEKNLLYELSGKEVKNLVAPNFSFEGGNPADPVYTIYIDGLNIGDEIAAFDRDILVGATQVNSKNKFDNELPVFSTLNSGNGYSPGNPIILKLWNNAENKEIILNNYTFSNPYGDAWTENVFPEEDGEYSLLHFSATGISDDNEMNQVVSIYPNPSNGIFNISIKGVSEKIQIKVFDILGNDHRFFEIEGTRNLITQQLDLKELGAGVYFVSFNGKNFNRVKKIVVQ